jgi:hypothetical protein
MKVSLNYSHMLVWRRYLVGWAAFVAFGIVAGWHLHPRLDEVVFMIALPLWIIVPYAVISLVAAMVRAWLWPTPGTRWIRYKPGKRIWKITSP